MHMEVDALIETFQNALYKFSHMAFQVLLFTSYNFQEMRFLVLHFLQEKNV